MVPLLRFRLLMLVIFAVQIIEIQTSKRRTSKYFSNLIHFSIPKILPLWGFRSRSTCTYLYQKIAYRGFIFLLMDKVGEIKLENTVTVKLDCHLNEEVIVTNFKIIMDCLKELKGAQDGFSDQLQKYLNRLTSLEKNASEKQTHNTNQQDNKIQFSKAEASKQEGANGLNEGDKQNLLNLIKDLEKRTQKSENNIIDNIKDINVLNKNMKQAQEDIQKLKKLLQQSNTSKEGNQQSGKVQFGSESFRNINAEILKNKEDTDKLREELDKLKNQVSSLNQKLNQLMNDSTKIGESEDKTEKSKQNTVEESKNSTGGGDISRAQFNELRDKVGVIHKKANGLEVKTQELKDGQEILEKGYQNLNEESEKMKKDIEELKKLIEGFGNKGNDSEGGANKSDDFEHLKRLLDQLKKDLEHLKKDQQNAHSKTSIEEENPNKNRFDKANYTTTKFKDDDKLKELTSRVDYLEKLMGSKNSINHDDSKGTHDKLPMIRRPKGRDRDASIHQKSSAKKDMAEIKNQLQTWLNNYLANMKSRDNFEDLELKIQQLKLALNKKADQEGLKKGLMFLQSKINQLYMFLTEPDGEDAMIVRKGFNCLSCSKKVQKLRGKIGPHIGWNNMTATNYSPPKVGYSRHMNNETPEREDQL